MKFWLWLPICLVLLWVCVAPRFAAAEDVDITDCFETDLTPAAQFVACRVAAEQGYADAQFRVGFMYYHGEGVLQDYVQAVAWYRRAAEQGHAGAQSNLGVMYSGGWGIPENDVEAVKWYRRAAEQGHAGAWYNLGVMYNNGEGVPQDYILAHMWYNLAGTGVGGKHARESRDNEAVSKMSDRRSRGRRSWAKVTPFLFMR